MSSAFLLGLRVPAICRGDSQIFTYGLYFIDGFRVVSLSCVIPKYLCQVLLTLTYQ